MLNSNPKILLLDIETAPNLAYVWGLFKQNVAINQLVEPSRILCWAAKWYGKKGTFFGAEWTSEDFLQRLHDLMSEADAVVSYNGNKFDLPRINGEFIRRGVPPAPPIPSIDLYVTARKLGYPSAKLEFVAQHLGVGQKLKHSGFEMWVKVLAGDPKAQKEMERYNRRDTTLLQSVYTVLRPYIKTHPYLGSGSSVECPACKSTHVQKRGIRRTKAYFVERLHCQSCGAWSDGKKTKVPVIGK